MSRDIDILKSAQDYIEKHSVSKTPEELFIEFKKKVQLHREFEKYLKEKGLNEKLEKMRRGKRLLAKRKLFVEWYVVLTQNEINITNAFIDLSELTFTTTRTIHNDLSNETTV